MCQQKIVERINNKQQSVLTTSKENKILDKLSTLSTTKYNLAMRMLDCMTK